MPASCRVAGNPVGRNRTPLLPVYCLPSPPPHLLPVSTELYYRSKALQQTVGLTEYNAERKKKKQREVLQERIAFEKPKSVLGRLALRPGDAQVR